MLSATFPLKVLKKLWNINVGIILVRMSVPGTPPKILKKLLGRIRIDIKTVDI